MGGVVTLAERRMVGASRRTGAADIVASRLSSHARRHGGRFNLLGSAARGRTRYNSGIDILVDFQRERELDAMLVAEDACAKESLPCDIMPFESRPKTLMDLVRDDMAMLP